MATPPAWPNPATQRWLVIDLGQMPDCSANDRFDLFARGLNNNGVVVGYAQDSSPSGCHDRAWVWTPCGEFGLPAMEMRSLAAMIPTTVRTDANDINDAGIVAGLRLGGSNNSDRPYVWNLALYNSGTGLAPSFELGLTTDNFGVATDVDDGAPAGVVGTVETSSGERGFRYVWGDPATQRTILDPFTGQNRSSARGASVAASSGQPVIAGTSWATFGSVQSCADLVSFNGIRWTIAAPIGKTELREDFLTGSPPPANLLLWEAESRAVNANGMSGGQYRDPLLACKKRAVFWGNGGLARDLGTLAPLDPLAETTVNALTTADASNGVVVVGDDAIGNRGVMWWRPSGSSTFTALRTVDICFRPETWQLQSFTDINDKGWIVGFGRRPSLVSGVGLTPPRAFLMIPDFCPFDLTGDLLVDGADLGVVVGAFGPCSGCCPADLNGSGTVDGADLGAILGAWGTVCSLCEEGEPFAMSEATNGTETDLEGAATVVLSMFGFADLPSFSAWFNAQDAEKQAEVVAAIVAALGL